MLAAGRRVRWDWLSPLAAVVVFEKIIAQWWVWYGGERIAAGMTYEMVFSDLAGTVLIFLLAATALPDEFPELGVDLREHYAKSSQRFWILFTLEWLLMTAVTLWVQVAVAHAHPSFVSPVWLVLPVMVSLIFVSSRWWHTLCLAGFAVIYLVQHLGQHLGPSLPASG